MEGGVTLKLQYKDYKEIKKWIYRNGRQIESSLWEFHFEGGTVENVLRALEFYQNEDGGFGNALEPDSWNPESSPYTTLYAINMLKSIGFVDKNAPIYQGIIRYLESRKYFENKQWMFSIPTNDNYPHAPWWNYHPEENKTQSIGVTAKLTAFILNTFDENSELYKISLTIARDILHKLMDAENHGEMGIGSYIILMDTLKTLTIEIDYLDKIQQKLNELVRHSIEQDTSKWQFHVVRPSKYITSPDSPYYEENKEIIEAELNYIIQTKPKDDVWGITWTWFDNNEKYAKDFAISENWWKCSKAIETLIYLRNFNRLQLEN